MFISLFFKLKLKTLKKPGVEQSHHSKTVNIVHKTRGKLLDVGSDTIPLGFNDLIPLNGNYVGLAPQSESVVSYKALAVETQGDELLGKFTSVKSCTYCMESALR